MRHLSAIAVLVAFAACGKPKTLAHANTCASRPATYLIRYIEKGGGSCGGIPDVVFNVNADGTIPGSQPDCDGSEQQGCTQRNTGCKVAKNGIDCDQTSAITFADDGTTAAGLSTLNCSSTSSACVSTYAISFTRQ